MIFQPQEYDSKVCKIWDTLWKLFPMQQQAMLRLEEKIDYKFKNKALLYEALTHRSLCSEINTRNFRKKLGLSQNCSEAVSIPWNERLEFLGDSVLSLAMSTLLWDLYPKDTQEGPLSKHRSFLVNEKSLATKARDIDLSSALLLGKGEAKNGGRKRDALLADALESLIAAIYLDNCYEQAFFFIKKLFKNDLAVLSSPEEGNFKSQLQELVQEKSLETPQYQIVTEKGPDHSKEFVMGVYLNNKLIGKGFGASKKKASQEAARNALQSHFKKELD